MSIEERAKNIVLKFENINPRYYREVLEEELNAVRSEALDDAAKECEERAKYWKDYSKNSDDLGHFGGVVKKNTLLRCAAKIRSLK